MYFSPQKCSHEQDCIVLLLGLFKLAVKNVSENCGSSNFCFKASTLKTLRLYLLPALVSGLSPRFCPGTPLTPHSHVTPGKHCSCGRASGAVPGAAPGVFYFSPLFLGGRFTKRPAPDHWQQDFRPVQELAFTEGSRGEESNSGRTSAEQTRLRAAPSQAVSARPWSPSSLPG